MTPYERGFAAGERKAWQDRGSFMRLIRPERIRGDYMRGWWDGYEPRSKEWSMRKESECHWSEKQEAA